MTINEQNMKSAYLDVVKMNGLALKRLPDDAQDDVDVVLEAIKDNHCALEFASDRLRKDKDFILKAIDAEAAGLVISYADDRLKNDTEIRQ